MKEEKSDQKITRRDFLGKIAIGSFWAAVGAAVLGMIRLPKPSVMPEGSSRLKLGYPDDFLPGTVHKFEEKNVFVFSDQDGVYAISAVCTHLGCIVTRTQEGKFDCPCHGSVFEADGRVTSGPAPRGLDWIEVRQAPNGILFADVSKTVPPGTKWKA